MSTLRTQMVGVNFSTCKSLVGSKWCYGQNDYVNHHCSFYVAYDTYKEMQRGTRDRTKPSQSHDAATVPDFKMGDGLEDLSPDLLPVSILRSHIKNKVART